MRILEHNAQVLSVAFSPDGQTILANTLEGGTFLWEARTGKVLRRFPQAASETLFALFSPDGHSIFSPGLAYGEATIYDIASSDERRLWQAVGTFSAAFSRDGVSLLIGGEDGKQGVVQMFGVEAGQLQQYLRRTRNGKLIVSSIRQMNPVFWLVPGMTSTSGITPAESCCII